jgi:hypothetical protein
VYVLIQHITGQSSKPRTVVAIVRQDSAEHIVTSAMFACVLLLQEIVLENFTLVEHEQYFIEHY